MMSKKWFSARAVFWLSFACFIWPGKFGGASFDEDPVKETQSDVVPVTEELLTREGESGPASPTFKMSDTSGFLVKKPYQKAEKESKAEPTDELLVSFWDDWFSWEEEDEGENQKGDEINFESELAGKK